VKIEARCQTCDRVFLLSQIGPDSDAPGRCPFCGARFGRHYTGVLIESVPQAEASADDFIHALGKIQAMETGFQIDIEGFLRAVAEHVRDNESHRATG